jgi:hypothetical protein
VNSAGEVGSGIASTDGNGGCVTGAGWRYVHAICMRMSGRYGFRGGGRLHMSNVAGLGRDGDKQRLEGITLLELARGLGGMYEGGRQGIDKKAKGGGVGRGQRGDWLSFYPFRPPSPYQ